ncbi:MAG: peptidase S41, partial [Undibacterium sp.]|nr:peptidase S41 [Undibacterium sp.]
MKIRPFLLSLSLSGMISAAYAQTPNQAYVRFPSVSSDAVVFTAEGDLWKVGLSGGKAQRLSSHPGAETHSAISHDGKWIAFTASYEGAAEAYVMSSNGGLPKRISFDNSNVSVLGWTQQGEVLVTAQNQVGPALQTVISSINPNTLQSKIFPVVDANEAVLDEAGKTLYFTRLGLHTRGDNAKMYRGGGLAQLWKFDLSGNATNKSEAVQLFAKEKSNNRRPMLWKNRLFFLSDRDGAYNLYSANVDGTDVRTLSKHKDWEVRNPTLGDGKIVYQLGANLHLLDVANQQDKLLPVELVSDFDQSRSRYIKNPLEFLTSVQMAAKDEKLVFTARGQMSVAGTGTQRRVDLTLPDGARAREAIFSGDDRYVYAFVDSSGENEIWRFPSNGNGKGEQLTHDGKTHRLNIVPSPDGKFLAHSDKHGRLFLLDLVTKTNIIIDDAGKLGFGTHEEITWSPDSKTIAIVRDNSTQGRSQIGLYDLESKQTRFVTNDRYESSSPTFSSDGKWMYFLSNRNFQTGVGSPWGDRNMGTYFDKRTGIFAFALQPGNRFPFKPDDELSSANNKVSNNAENKLEIKDESNKVATPANPATPKKNGNAIVYQGLAERLYELPVPAGNYRHLATDDKRLYFLERDPIDRNRSSLKTLTIAKTSPQVEVFSAGLRSYDLSNDKKHIFFQTSAGAGEFYVVDAGAKAPGELAKAKIKIEDWSFNSNPRQEWKQMFNDAWRMHRDFLYDSNMRGVDWKKMYTKYLPLVDRVTDRAELNDVLSLLISEVS